MYKSRMLAGMAVCATVAVAGCQTTNPYTGEQQTSKTTIGAGIGALAGAVLGAATGKDAKDRRKRALIGAGVGGLAGAGIGAYMDKQEAELRQKLAGTGVSVTRQGDNIVLNMPGNITFKTGSADLNADFYKVLDGVGIVVDEYEKTLIVVEGHTDSVGSDEMNQALSERRAATVGQYIASRQNVNDQRVLTAGFGESRPIASNDTDAGRAQNRRVEVRLEPITQG
jgi:outer membrane protein OmpA-like peptidoglycan-associated protein